MHISFKIIKFYFTLCCSTCFCVHHQELLIAAHAVCGHRVVLGRVRESSSNNGRRLEETTDPTPHGDQRLHVQQYEAPDDGHSGVRNMSSSIK
jgi:hypothetical protein